MLQPSVFAKETDSKQAVYGKVYFIYVHGVKKQDSQAFYEATKNYIAISKAIL